MVSESWMRWLKQNLLSICPPLAWSQAQLLSGLTHFFLLRWQEKDEDGTSNLVKLLDWRRKEIEGFRNINALLSWVRKMHERNRQMTWNKAPKGCSIWKRTQGLLPALWICPCCPSLRGRELGAEHLLLLQNGPSPTGLTLQNTFLNLSGRCWQEEWGGLTCRGEKVRGSF